MNCVDGRWKMEIWKMEITKKKHANPKIRAFLDTYFERISLVLFISTLVFMHVCALNLEHVAGEADEVGADAEAGTAAGGNGESRHVGVQNAKGGRGNESDETDFIQVQLALGDGVSGKGDQRTFNQILDSAFDQLA